MALETISGLEAELYIVQRRPDNTVSRQRVGFLRDFNFTRSNNSIARRDVSRSGILSFYKGDISVSGSFSTDAFLANSIYQASVATNYISNGDAELKIGNQAMSWTQSSGVTIENYGYSESTQAFGSGSGAGNSFRITDASAVASDSISQKINVPILAPMTTDTAYYSNSLQKNLFIRFAYRLISGNLTVRVFATDFKTGVVNDISATTLTVAGDGTVTLPFSIEDLSNKNIDQLTIEFSSAYNASGIADVSNLCDANVTNISVGESPTQRFVNRRQTMDVNDMYAIEYDMPLTNGDVARYAFVGVEFTSFATSDPQDINSESVTFTAIDMVHIDPIQAASGFFYYGDGAFYGETTLGGA